MQVEAYCNIWYAVIAYSGVLTCWLLAYKDGYAKDSTGWFRLFLFSPLTFPYLIPVLALRLIHKPRQ